MYFEKITDPLMMQSYFTICLVSFSLCCLIIYSASFGFLRRAHIDENAIQSAHIGFVPRVGGLAVLLSIVGFIPLSNFGIIPISLVLDLNTKELAWLVFTCTPVFAIGLAEDLGFPMSSRKRLFSSVFSGILVIYIFGVWVDYIGVPGFDYFLSFVPIALAFTLFATACVLNAFNLIDGLNGLSSYVAISTAISLSWLAFAVDHLQILFFVIIISFAVLGFMFLNFPMGKIFLGDAGAYVLGHLLVWTAIMLVDFNSMISPFAILLIFFWPVADTALAIWRRWVKGSPADRADRLHFHQLAMRYLEIRFLGRKKRNISNPLATVILIPMISVPQIFGILFWDNLGATIWATIIMIILFISAYNLGIHNAKKLRQKKDRT